MYYAISRGSMFKKIKVELNKFNTYQFCGYKMIITYIIDLLK